MQNEKNTLAWSGLLKNKGDNIVCVHYWKIEPSCSVVDGKIRGKCSKCGEEAEFLDWSGITNEEYMQSLPARTRGRINRLANYENPPVTLSEKVKCPLAR